MQNYEDTIKYLYSLQSFGIKLGLKSIGDLLGKLSSPQNAYKTIHIAGTNGKGSTATAIESVLIDAGYRVGLYTSPHLVDFKERIRVNRDEIDEDSVVRITELVRRKKEELELDCEITFFEYITALALYYFMESEVDIAIIEVGLGGRLDATNVITPMVSVITSISKEHQQYLGETIDEIAGEKAGIIKEAVPVISGVRNICAKNLIRSVADRKGSKIFQLGTDFNFEISGEDTFDYRGLKKGYDSLKKSLIGRHQYDNFSVALAALEVIEGSGFKAREENIRNGFSAVRWPGRFEVVSEEPLIILDGAHNDKSMELAVDTIKERFPDKKVITVIGVMKDKDIESMAKRVNDISETVILTRPEIERAAEPDRIAGFFYSSTDIRSFLSVKNALDHAKSLCSDGSIIFVTGSLFTVGDARKYLISNR